MADIDAQISATDFEGKEFSVREMEQILILKKKKQNLIILMEHLFVI